MLGQVSVYVQGHPGIGALQVLELKPAKLLFGS